MSVVIEDHTAEVLAELDRRCMVAIERCGLKAESYAIGLCPVDTGALKNSITHNVRNESPEFIMTLGSDSEYATYVECGTGKYYPGGRDTPWAFQDSKGEWHTTRGSKAQSDLTGDRKSYAEMT